VSSANRRPEDNPFRRACCNSAHRKRAAAIITASQTSAFSHSFMIGVGETGLRSAVVVGVKSRLAAGPKCDGLFEIHDRGNIRRPGGQRAASACRDKRPVILPGRLLSIMAMPESIRNSLRE
jgi:hypothetical protein